MPAKATVAEKPAQLTKRDVQKRIAGLSLDQQKATVCALVGHSRIHNFCWGYHHCARCMALLGDSLAGAYKDDSAVYPPHLGRTDIPACHCAQNLKTLTWRDTLLTPPLKEIA